MFFSPPEAEKEEAFYFCPTIGIGIGIGIGIECVLNKMKIL